MYPISTTINSRECPWDDVEFSIIP
jgi:hypothetical protein